MRGWRRPTGEGYPAGSNARLLLWISNDSLNPDTLSGVTTSAAKSVRIVGDPIIPGQTLADFATDDGTQVIVTGFLQDQYYGESIPMTFSFANAGTLSLNIPIEVPPERSTDRETIEILPPHPTPIWEEGEHGAEAAAGTTGETHRSREAGHDGEPAGGGWPGRSRRVFVQLSDPPSRVRHMRSTMPDRSSRPSKSAVKPAFRCNECGHEAAKWHGRCPECQAWGTLIEAAPAAVTLRRLTAGPVTTPAQRIDQVSADQVSPQASGVTELDRVLGGGLTPGAVVLLAGEPGVGKSTLLLSAAKEWASNGQGPVLIVSGEESAAQVRLRADRMGALHPDIYLAAESDLAAVLGHVDQVHPRLLIVDSVQTIATGEVEGSAGGVSQVRAVAAALSAVAKERNMACVLVGHVTKDGGIAGPRVLEHLVDVVLQFEGDRHSTLRTIRGVKNRYGPADEVGCFQMVPDGIVGTGRSVRAISHPSPHPGTGDLRDCHPAGPPRTAGRVADADRPEHR